MFKIPSFKDVLNMTKEALEESMIPLRIRSAKAKAESQKVKLEEKMLTLEQQIHTACSAKELDFDRIGDLMDDYEMAERRLEQINAIVNQLFPE